jgi:hypothetical protein
LLASYNFFNIFSFDCKFNTFICTYTIVVRTKAVVAQMALAILIFYKNPVKIQITKQEAQQFRQVSTKKYLEVLMSRKILVNWLWVLSVCLSWYLFFVFILIHIYGITCIRLKKGKKIVE